MRFNCNKPIFQRRTAWLIFLKRIVKLARNLLAKTCANLLDFLKTFISSQEFPEQSRQKTTDFYRQRKLPFVILVLFLTLQLLQIGNKIGNIVFTKKIVFIKDFRQQASEFFAVVGTVPLMKKPWPAGNTIPEDISIMEGFPVDTLGKILLCFKKRT